MPYLGVFGSIALTMFASYEAVDPTAPVTEDGGDGRPAAGRLTDGHRLQRRKCVACESTDMPYFYRLHVRCR